MIFLIVVACSLMGPSFAADWAYTGAHGPDNWSGACKTGKSQSPIDIPDQVTYDSGLSSLLVKGYYGNFDLKMTNNGHTAKLELVTPPSEPYMSGGKLPGKMLLAQFHFHWGTSDTTGSEHKVGGKQYPLEVHFVHLNSDKTAPNSEKASVLGFFFEIGAENTDWKPIFDGLINVKYTDQTTNIAGINLKKLLGDIEFYRYSGGLTTPDCDEIVTWNVCSKPIQISAVQMAKFRVLTKSTQGTTGPKLIDFNYRPIQPLNGRKVTVSSQNLVDGAPATSMSLLVMIVTVVAGKLMS